MTYMVPKPKRYYLIRVVRKTLFYNNEFFCYKQPQYGYIPVSS